MNWSAPSRLTRLAATGLAVALAASACAGGASASPSPAMIESPSPSAVSSGTFHAVDGTARHHGLVS
jgi:ABC-type glycerol-3-phosphate transport system substrate-binding protein